MTPDNPAKSPFNLRMCSMAGRAPHNVASTVRAAVSLPGGGYPEAVTGHQEESSL